VRSIQVEQLNKYIIYLIECIVEYFVDLISELRDSEDGLYTLTTNSLS